MQVKTVNISTVDYILLLFSILIPLAIAIWTGFRNKKTTQDFFTARQSMGPVPVAMSLLSTNIGGFMILAYSADVYGYGLEYSLTLPASLIGIPFFTYMNLKVFYDLKVATIYEYLELRYHSGRLRTCLMSLEALSKIIGMGVSLCGSCLVLSAVTPVKVETCIIILGSLCAFYATIGGMRGIIWTDSFMMLVMFAGLFAVIVLGSLQLGPSDIWNIAREGGRTTIFNFNPSIYQRQNFYLVIVAGFLGYGKLYGTNQLSLQRALSLKSFSQYKYVLAVVMLGYVIMMGLMFGAGLTAYSIYAGCDPLTDGKIRKMDQIIPFLISDKMSHIPGIAGLFLSAIVCAGVSSVSSYMNAFSNLVFSDLISKIKLCKKLSERSALLLCRAMSELRLQFFRALLMAIPTIGFAILAAKTEGLLVFITIAFSLLAGPTYGIFLLGLLFPMTKLRPNVIGFFVSMGILIWITVGRILYKAPDPYLPLSTGLCNATDRTAASVIEHLRSVSSANGTQIETSSSGSLYGVSYLSFYVIGPFVCMLVGVCVTYLTGKQKVENVPKELVSPFVRGFFYKGRKDQDEQQTELNVKS